MIFPDWRLCHHPLFPLILCAVTSLHRFLHSRYIFPHPPLTLDCFIYSLLVASSISPNGKWREGWAKITTENNKGIAKRREGNKPHKSNIWENKFIFIIIWSLVFFFVRWFVLFPLPQNRNLCENWSFVWLHLLVIHRQAKLILRHFRYMFAVTVTHPSKIMAMLSIMSRSFDIAGHSLFNLYYLLCELWVLVCVKWRNWNYILLVRIFHTGAPYSIQFWQWR